MIEYFSIPTEVCSMLEALNYEVESRKQLIAHMIDCGVSLESDSAKKYMQEYEEFSYSYSAAKDIFESMYVVPAVQKRSGKLPLSWKVHFTDCTCEVTVQD